MKRLVTDRRLRTCIIFAGLSGGAIAAIPTPSMAAPLAGADSTRLTGVLRDFRERQVPGGHPDMENLPDAGGGHYMGNIADVLDSDGKPVFAGGGSKVNSQWTDSSGRPLHPTLFDAARGDIAGSYGVADDGGITSATSFSQWFRDVPGVNMSAPFSIDLAYDSVQGTYIFDDRLATQFASLSGFFPVNNQMFGNSQGGNKNFHFTYELITEFVHDSTAGHTFTFSGDDDVWVFIDNRLVIDIGGVHSAVEQSVELDRLDWLVDGEVYELHFFFAERHRTQSNFRIETTLNLRTGKMPPTSGLYD